MKGEIKFLIKANDFDFAELSDEIVKTFEKAFGNIFTKVFISDRKVSVKFETENPTLAKGLVLIDSPMLYNSEKIEELCKKYSLEFKKLIFY